MRCKVRFFYIEVAITLRCHKPFNKGNETEKIDLRLDTLQRSWLLDFKKTAAAFAF